MARAKFLGVVARGVVSRSHTVSFATADTDSVLGTVRRLPATATPMIDQRGITLIGVAVGNLGDSDPVQLALPLDGRGGGDLDAALDGVASGLDTPRSPGRCCSVTTPGLSVRVLPD